MTGNEQLSAEVAWMRRRGVAAAPDRHPLRTAQCPSLGALARGHLSEQERRHVDGCRHCRSVQRAAVQTRFSSAPAVGAIAAAIAVGALLSGWLQPAPARFTAPAVRVSEPAPRAIAAEWPSPLRLRPPGVRLPAPAERSLPVIRPLERFSPPERSPAPVPVAALGVPEPPALVPAPAPDVVGMLGLRVL